MSPDGLERLSREELLELRRRQQEELAERDWGATCDNEYTGRKAIVCRASASRHGGFRESTLGGIDG